MKRKILLIICIVLLVSGLVFGLSGAQQAQAGAQTGTVTYNLYATDGFVTMADGTVVYTYGFVGGRDNQPLYLWNNATGLAVPYDNPNTLALGPEAAPAPTSGPITPAEQLLAGKAAFPAPIIYAAVNDTVIINLKNLGVTNKSAPNDPHTIHLHGLDVDAANDGVPETSVAAVPANLAKTPGAGNIVVYMFTPTKPGTYMWHCHQEADIHVQMGMYGALVVYEQGDAAALTGPGKSQGGTLWGWNYTKDYILLLSEFDLGQHKAEQFAGAAGGYNPVNYKPQYWFVNGLSFPNTVHAGIGAGGLFNFTEWEKAHPGYDPFIIGSVGTPGSTNPDRVLLRVINMGFQTQPMHMHGFHAKILGSDQRAWPWANTIDVWDQGMEKNTLTIGSGETYEWLINFDLQSQFSTYQPGVETRYNPVNNLPVVNTDPAFPAIPDMFAPGFAYIGGPRVGPDGNQGPIPPALPAELPVTTGQYFPFHNHDDYKATNNGVYPGGMFTLIVTTP